MWQVRRVWSALPEGIRSHLEWRRGLAVVFGGGAMLGAFEVGVIDALARHDVRPDLLVGTSVGALNAVYWAFNPGRDAGRRLLDQWLGSDVRAVFAGGRLSVLQRLLRRQDHLLDSAGLAGIVERTVGDGRRLEEARIPLAVVAADAFSGERVVLREGPVTTAVRASAAIPALFPPVALGDRMLVDGGMVANCDVETPLEAGMTDALVVDLMGDAGPRAATDVWEVVERSVGLGLRRQTDLALRTVAGRMRIMVLRPRFGLRTRLTDTSRTAALFEFGRSAGEEVVRAHLSGGRVRPGMLEPQEPGAQSAAGARRRPAGEPGLASA